MNALIKWFSLQKSVIKFTPKMFYEIAPSSKLVDSCDIAFYNFCHQKVRNFEISNQFKRHRNFTVIFRR
jgi:hypothetical protein